MGSEFIGSEGLLGLLESNSPLGRVVRMDYTSATIATLDYYINIAGGVPRNCFLLAVPNGAEGEMPREAILLRVRGLTELDLSRELRAVKEQLAASEEHRRLDAMTEQRMQIAGYDCKIMGTFYEDEDGGLTFGSDVDRILAAQSYEVLKPHGSSLSIISSYSRKGSLIAGDSKMVRLGRVRYSETEKNADLEAGVFIDVKDLIGKKTAVLGMSRSGKALTEDTLLPVPVSEKFPTGWARNDELELGDLLFATNGGTTAITNFTAWKTEPVYEVKFADGQVASTSGGHLWMVNDHREELCSNTKMSTQKHQSKVEVLEKIDSIIAQYDNGTYMKLSDLVKLTGFTMDHLELVAKESGIERHLGISHSTTGEMGKTPMEKDNLYPVVELLQVIRQRIVNGGDPLHGRELPPTTRLMSTEEIARSIGVSHRGRAWRVPVAAPINYNKSQLTTHPYMLGYWLGDGNSVQGYITVDSNEDAWDEAGSDREHFMAQARALGYSVEGDYEDAPYRVLVHGLSGELKKLNLIKNKHIPMEYLRGSFEDRVSLLQGLMDSDGTVSQRGGRCYFSNGNKGLFDQVVELVRSLGCTVTVSSMMGSDKDKHGNSVDTKLTYTAGFKTDFATFRLPRKLNRQEKALKPHERYNAIVSIKKKGEGRLRCVTVDAKDSLHLVEGFIPTHNSNTVKQIAQQVFHYSKENNVKIGQLIFDPQGEYANTNAQDMGSSLASMGNGHDVVIYRTQMKGVGYERQLLLNLLEEDNLELLWDLMLIELRNGISASANYIAGLNYVDFIKPDKTVLDSTEYPRAMVHYQRKRLGLYAFMKLARFTGPINNLEVNVGRENNEEVLALHEDLTLRPIGGNISVGSVDAAHRLFTWILQQERNGNRRRVEEESQEVLLGVDGLPVEEEPLIRDEQVLSESWIKDLQDGPLEEFKKQFEQYEKGRSGVVAAFQRIKDLHTNDSSGDLRTHIWEDIKAGKLIIVDLSVGSPTTITTLSELIVESLIQHSSERFTNGLKAVQYQIVVEEAHNLFSRHGVKEDAMDPWVRLSKEGAKYEIGLVYGTQEVTGVDSRILSNTSNFIITHLNSTTEVRELSKYYSFADWSDQIIASESRGFARVKTESSPFIIPVQIDKFNPLMEDGE